MSTATLLLASAAALSLTAPLAHAQRAAIPSHEPVFSASGERFVQKGGENVYRAVCQGCHMPQGEGAKGAGMYPALAGNPKLAAAAYPLFVVLYGLHGMPSFAARLDDQQVADVVNYVRTNFGNRYADPSSADDVKNLRPR